MMLLHFTAFEEEGIALPNVFLILEFLNKYVEVPVIIISI